MATELTTHTPPQEVSDTAKKGLELAQKTGLVSSPNIRQIGQALASGEPQTRERLRHLGAYFQAHRADASVPSWGKEDSPSPAWIGFLLHGGEAGQAWVNDKVSKKVDMATGVPGGYEHRDFLDHLEGPPYETQQRTTQEELASDAEYRAVLSRSDPRILAERGGRILPNPLAPKAPPTPGSEAEYVMLLDRLDPRIRMKQRR
jgi:hypothetical protein